MIFFLFVSLRAYGVSFFVFNPEERARIYIDRAFGEYRKALRNNPGNKKLFNEYTSILKVRKGEINTEVEIALFFREIGMEQEADNLLLEVMLKDKRKKALCILNILFLKQGLLTKESLFTQLSLRCNPTTEIIGTVSASYILV